MNPSKRIFTIVSSILFLASQGMAEETKTPGYNQLIPPSIMTADEVETSIGTLEFFDGMPSEKTVELVYDNLDRMRGVEVFLDFVPLASIEGLRRGAGGVSRGLEGEQVRQEQQEQQQQRQRSSRSRSSTMQESL